MGAHADVCNRYKHLKPIDANATDIGAGCMRTRHHQIDRRGVRIHGIGFAKNPRQGYAVHWKTQRIGSPKEVFKMQDSTTITAKPKKSLNIFGQPVMIFGVPVDQKTIFSNYKGIYKKRVEKRQRKLIIKIAFITFFLESEERIFCITTGYSPITVLEQVITGLAFLFFKRAILIFTGNRLVHVPMRLGAKSPGAVSQILYEDCTQMTLKGRALIVQYKNGRQERFPYIGRREKKKVKSLLEAIPFEPKEARSLQGRQYLCPSCTQLLAEKAASCQTCQLKFRSPLAATLRAVAIPGGGYFYGRYPIMGTIIALVELTLIGFLAIQWIDISKGLPIDYLLIALLTAGFILTKTIVTYHARQLVRDLLPVKKEFSLRKLTPLSKSKADRTEQLDD